jgi:hypothetical protein
MRCSGEILANAYKINENVLGASAEPVIVNSYFNVRHS